jgi:hypothetical protein
MNKIMYKGFLGVLLLYVLSFPFETKAQVFGEYQSARITEKGSVEITGSYTSSTLYYDDWSSRLLNVLGLQTGIGMGERFELRLRYDRHYYHKGEISNGFNLIGIAPKYSLLKDKISALLPLSMSFSENASMWQLQPSVLISLPVSKKLELNFTTRYFISLDEEAEGGGIFLNLGFAVGNIGEWAIRPETGLSFKPGDSGSIWNYGMGASRTFGKVK